MCFIISVLKYQLWWLITLWKLPLINADLTWVMTESSFSPLYELPGYSLLLLKDFASGQMNPVGSTWVYLKDSLRFSSLQQKIFFFKKKFQSFHVFSYISINWFCYLSREFLSASFGKFSYTAATYLHVMLLFFHSLKLASVCLVQLSHMEIAKHSRGRGGGACIREVCTDMCTVWWNGNNVLNIAERNKRKHWSYRASINLTPVQCWYWDYQKYYTWTLRIALPGCHSYPKIQVTISLEAEGIAIVKSCMIPKLKGF